MINSGFALSLFDANYRSEFKIDREIATKTPKETYKRWLEGWRVDTFDFDDTPPEIIEWGDENTGVGNIIVRPVNGLKEEILEHKTEPHLAVVYTILNPSFKTLPVRDYVSQVSFMERGDGEGTLVEWHSKWNPKFGLDWWTGFLVRLVLRDIITYLDKE